MAKGINRLTALNVARAKPGMYADGGGLWLRAQPNGRAWVFRYTSPVTGKERRMGLGTSNDIGLAEARDAAHEARLLLRQGLDPLNQKQAQKAAKLPPVTFKTAAEACIDSKRPGWRNAKHADQWCSTLEAYVYPSLGKRPVRAISRSDVLDVLTEIWQTKPETASRVRGRIETILDYAKQRDWRTGENPAAWKGNLEHVLAPTSKIARVEHHAALPWQRMPEVMAKLAKSDGISALVVRFTALTAVRPSEARRVTWSEIDLKESVWTIPADRMKSGKEHRVPLSTGALAILHTAKELADLDAGTTYVFRANAADKPLSDVAVSKALHTAAGTKDVTVHGLRSTFRDWVADATDFQADVAEAALAHALGDAVRVAYQRGDLFAKRRELMEGWMDYLCSSEMIR